jgi:hypothetical protein
VLPTLLLCSRRSFNVGSRRDAYRSVPLTPRPLDAWARVRSPSAPERRSPPRFVLPRCIRSPGAWPSLSSAGHIGEVVEVQAAWMLYVRNPMVTSCEPAPPSSEARGADCA